MNFEDMPLNEQFFAGVDEQALKISHPWPREAEDRVNRLLGEIAAKELECQRLREQVRSLAQMLEDCAERLAFLSGANGEHTISFKCLKVAADVLRPN